MRMMALLGALTCLLSSTGLAISTVRAQPLTKPDTTSCELHIWPSSGLGSIFHGWIHGNIVNGAVTGRKGYPQVPTDPINTDAQRELLSHMPLADLLDLPKHRPVIHENALDSGIIRSTQARVSKSSSPCYAEFIIDDVIFQQDFATGRYLKIVFHFRDFGSATTPQRGFGTWARDKLTLFPAKGSESADAARADIQRAFRADVEQFANYLRRSEQARK